MSMKKPKKVPNQFNYCERAALTYVNPVRVSFNERKMPLKLYYLIVKIIDINF